MPYRGSNTKDAVNLSGRVNRLRVTAQVLGIYIGLARLEISAQWLMIAAGNR
jgi:hypothetical protein